AQPEDGFFEIGIVGRHASIVPGLAPGLLTSGPADPRRPRSARRPAPDPAPRTRGRRAPRDGPPPGLRTGSASGPGDARAAPGPGPRDAGRRAGCAEPCRR